MYDHFPELHPILPPEIFSQLSSKELLQIRSLTQYRCYSDGQNVYRQDDIADYFYWIKEGQTGLTAIRDDGHEIIRGIAKPGDIMGDAAVLVKAHYQETASAMGTAVVYRMSGRDFHRLSRTYPEMLHHVCIQLSHKLLKAEGRLTQIMFKKVDTRVREALAEIANLTEIADSNKPVTIAVTQQHIANLIGASRQETSKALRRLEDRAIIKLQYGSIVVTSPGELCESVSGMLQRRTGC
jgi:CRP/FNR family transcriptional regulator, cyclic AMP receptor protein